jgi:predicted RecA/RadA family phage recombinase
MARKIVARTGFTAANDATDLNQVGTIMDDASTGKSYRYVRVEDMALAANDVVAYSDATGGEVTQDRSGGSAISTDFAGVAVNTISDGNYGWVQIKGLATCRVLENTSVSEGDRVMLHDTDDGGVATLDTQTTSSVDKSFGVALANDTATTSADGTVAVMIDL